MSKPSLYIPDDLLRQWLPTGIDEAVEAYGRDKNSDESWALIKGVVVQTLSMEPISAFYVLRYLMAKRRVDIRPDRIECWDEVVAHIEPAFSQVSTHADEEEIAFRELIGLAARLRKGD